MSQEYKYCMSCGEKLPADAKFCKCCGRAAEEPTVERPPEEEKLNESKNASDNKPLTKRTIAVVLILTAVAAAGAAVLTVAGIRAAYGI